MSIEAASRGGSLGRFAAPNRIRSDAWIREPRVEMTVRHGHADARRDIDRPYDVAVQNSGKRTPHIEHVHEVALLSAI